MEETKSRRTWGRGGWQKAKPRKAAVRLQVPSREVLALAAARGEDGAWPAGEQLRHMRDGGFGDLEPGYWDALRLGPGYRRGAVWKRTGELLDRLLKVAPEGGGVVTLPRRWPLEGQLSALMRVRSWVQVFETRTLKKSSSEIEAELAALETPREGAPNRHRIAKLRKDLAFQRKWERRRPSSTDPQAVALLSIYPLDDWRRARKWTPRSRPPEEASERPWKAPRAQEPPKRRRGRVKIEPPRRTRPVSVRFPPELYDEVTAYAKRIESDRSYVIVECVRRVLDSDRAWKREWRKRARG